MMTREFILHVLLICVTFHDAQLDYTSEDVQRRDRDVKGDCSNIKSRYAACLRVDHLTAPPDCNQALQDALRCMLLMSLHATQGQRQNTELDTGKGHPIVKRGIKKCFNRSSCGKKPNTVKSAGTIYKC